ncbi:MAG: peroxiredoxin [Lewinellaceae bacterium]|nr:peroxiredoxin [Lewinellaceae bacterium]
MSEYKNKIKVKVGDVLPYFNAFLDDGKSIDESYFKNSKYVLFFYGTDGSPTCTNEAKSVANAYHEIQKMGFEVIGVSRDTVKSHQKFIQKENLPYRLVADPELHLHNVFGVYGPKIFMGKEVMGIYRTTFFINEKGVITHIIEDVVSKQHGDQILAVLKEI